MEGMMHYTLDAMGFNGLRRTAFEAHCDRAVLTL
jgi:hypothetical protein